MQGIVSRFEKRGYGFIDGDDGNMYFVHQNDLEMEGFRHLISGEVVEFNIGESDKGKKATNVKLIKKSPKRTENKPENKPKNIPKTKINSKYSQGRNNDLIKQLNNKINNIEESLKLLVKVLSAGGEDAIIFDNEANDILQYLND